jgi:hypothetical protein
MKFPMICNIGRRSGWRFFFSVIKTPPVAEKFALPFRQIRDLAFARNARYGEMADAQDLNFQNRTF